MPEAQAPVPAPAAAPAPAADAAPEADVLTVARIVTSVAAAKVAVRDQGGKQAKAVLPGFYVLDLEHGIQHDELPHEGVVTRIVLTEAEAELLPRLPEGRQVEITLKILPRPKPSEAQTVGGTPRPQRVPGPGPAGGRPGGPHGRRAR